MVAVKIHGTEMSAPVRIAYMAAEVSGVPYEKVEVDLSSGGNKKPEYLALNAQGTIPLLQDGDLVLKESRAIAGYLANKYDKTKKLYPTCPVVRARVDEQLYFDMGTFYHAFGECVYPRMFRGEKEVAPEKFEKLKTVLGWVKDSIKKTGFAAGTDHMTLADVAFVATYSTIKASNVLPNLSDCKILEDWFSKCVKLIPNYKAANGKGAADFATLYKSKCE